jgi:excisionase family DNA binding protein
MGVSETSLIAAMSTIRIEGIPMLIEFPSAKSPSNESGGRPLANLISVPEAARRVGLHADTLYRLCRTGQFSPAIQIGSRWRVSVPKLEQYLHGEDLSV